MGFEHWRYFISLEKDLEATFRYVEPTSANYRTYSIEFTRIILTACSEVDVLAKVLCEAVTPGSAPKNIQDYRAIICQRFPKFPTVKVLVPLFGLALEPWKEWSEPSTPGWWADHNKVKHRRHEHFALADLEHAVVSLGALFCLVLYVHHDDVANSRLRPRASLFTVEENVGRIFDGSQYHLPDFPANAG
jgi:hypothetical protein